MHNIHAIRQRNYFLSFFSVFIWYIIFFFRICARRHASALYAVACKPMSLVPTCNRHTDLCVCYKSVFYRNDFSSSFLSETSWIRSVRLSYVQWVKTCKEIHLTSTITASLRALPYAFWNFVGNCGLRKISPWHVDLCKSCQLSSIYDHRQLITLSVVFCSTTVVTYRGFARFRVW